MEELFEEFKRFVKEEFGYEVVSTELDKALTFKEIFQRWTITFKVERIT